MMIDFVLWRKTKYDGENISGSLWYIFFWKEALIYVECISFYESYEYALSLG